MSKAKLKLRDNDTLRDAIREPEMTMSEGKDMNAAIGTIVIKAALDLTAKERAVWSGIRANNRALRSPYFDVNYTLRVAGIRDDIRVIIASKDERPVAFLPIQGDAFALPVGAPMTDYHGVIAAADYVCDPVAMLAGAGVGVLHYEAWVRAGTGGDHPDARPCAAIAMPAGGADWRAKQGGSYRRHLKGLRRRTRKASEEYGEPRAELKTHNAAIFETLLSWKRAQYARTGKYDVLTTGWTEVLLAQLFEATSDESLRADMHALYFGDRLAAIDLGLTDGETYHSWITAYDPQFHAVSPGMQLLELIIEQSAELKYKVLDLGPGLEGYKHHYADENMGYVSSGFFAARGPAAALSKLYGAAEHAGERTDVAIGKLPGKLRRRYSQVSACDPSLSGRAKAMLSAVTRSGKSEQ